MLFQRNFWKLSATGMAVFVSIFTSSIPVTAEESLLNQNQADNLEYTIAQLNKESRRYDSCLRRADSREEKKYCKRVFGRSAKGRYRRRGRRYNSCLRKADSRREIRECRRIFGRTNEGRYRRSRRYNSCLRKADSRREIRECRRIFGRTNEGNNRWRARRWDRERRQRFRRCMNNAYSRRQEKRCLKIRRQKNPYAYD